MSPESVARRSRIEIDSDWISAIGLALLFLFFAFLLIREMRDLQFGKVDHPVHRYWIIVVVYCLPLAFSSFSKPMKVAFSLLAMELMLRLALAYLHASAGVRHNAAVAGSIASQISYAIILFEIAQWFKSVVRFGPPDGTGVADS